MKRFSLIAAILLAGDAGGRPLIEEATVDPAAPSAPALKFANQPVPPPPAADQAEEPRLSLPNRVTGLIGQFITVNAVTNGTECKWVAMDPGLNVFPADQLKDSRSTVVTSNAAGQYRLLAYTALANVPSNPATTIVVVLNGAQPPPVPPQPEPAPTPEPPKPPVPAPQPIPAIALWITTIDDATGRNPAVAAVLGDAALWGDLSARGHNWRKMNSSDPESAKYAAQIALNGGIPVVILMEYDPTNPATARWLNKTPADLKFPATSDGMQTLIRKYTTK